MQFPFAVLSEIIRDALGKKNVPGIPTIHHPLCHVDSSTSNVAPIIDIGYLVNRPAVDSHPQLHLGVPTQFAAKLLSTPHRCVHPSKENEHHAISRWQTNKLAGSLRHLELRSFPNGFV